MLVGGLFPLSYQGSPNRLLDLCNKGNEYLIAKQNRGVPGGSDGEESICHVGDLGSIPRSRISPREGNGSPPQYSCLEDLHGQRSLAGNGPWGCKELDTTEWLSKAQTE